MTEKRVYFMKPLGMAGPIKIGCSVMPEGRLKSLDIWSPFPLELVASAPGDNCDEIRLHWRFRADRSHGEWFLASADLLGVIDHVRLNGVLPPLEAPPERRGGRITRNVTWRTEKARLGRRINAAEIWAFGWLSRRQRRPAWVHELCSKYLGAHQAPLRGDDLAKMEDYISHLRSLPNGVNSPEELAAQAELDARWKARRAAAQAAA